MDKSDIFLKSPIGSGGEANIYTVRIRPELVANVYHQPHGDYARKLAFMVANPPVFQYYNPSDRRKESPKFSYVSLMRTAINLARAVRSVHSRGYLIGHLLIYQY